MNANELVRGESRAWSLVPLGFFLLIGPILWAVHLAAIYGVHAIACSRGLPETTITVATVILVMTGVTLAILLSLIAVTWRRQRTATPDNPDRMRLFFDRVMIMAALLSAFGIVWAGAAPLILPSC